MKTELQKQFEEQTPTIKDVTSTEYLQTFITWLHLQIEKASQQVGETVYYTAGFDKRLHETNNIIYLDSGDFVTIHEVHYEIIWKLFNAIDNIMVYHCKTT